MKTTLFLEENFSFPRTYKFRGLTINGVRAVAIDVDAEVVDGEIYTVEGVLCFIGENENEIAYLRLDGMEMQNDAQALCNTLFGTDIFFELRERSLSCEQE